MKGVEMVSLDGRTLVGVENASSGDVGTETRFRFKQTVNRIHAQYSGGAVVSGHLLGTLHGDQWEIRYVQLNEGGETACGHSIGEVSVLDDGRVRVEDEWEWESKPGHGESVLEEVIV